MIIFDDKSHGAKIAALAGVVFNPFADPVIARVTSEGNLMGGVVYKDYTGSSLTMHVAGIHPNWLSREMLWICFDYPFNQLHCTKVFGPLKMTNQKALEFDFRLGFKVDNIIRDVYPDGDLLLLSMYRENCRWLRKGNKLNGRKSSSTASPELWPADSGVHASS